jgi:hypothetical protein
VEWTLNLFIEIFTLLNIIRLFLDLLNTEYSAFCIINKGSQFGRSFGSLTIDQSICFSTILVVFASALDLKKSVIFFELVSFIGADL